MIIDQLPPMEVASRIDRLRGRFDDAQCSALIVSSLINIRYLTGFTGSAGVLWVDNTKAVLITDDRYRHQAPDEISLTGSNVEVEIKSRDQEALLNRFSNSFISVGVEAKVITWEQMTSLSGALSEVNLLPTKGLVEDLRSVKDYGEIARIEAAAFIADSALAEVWPLIEENLTEREIAVSLDQSMILQGADERAFTTIVASGPNSALPHACPGERILQNGDLVVCDLGAVVNGYRSDMTRCKKLGENMNNLEADLLGVVLKAQEEALNMVADGVSALEVDKACRDVLDDAGLSDAFIHGTGHGVGLEIHETPTISSLATTTLRENQVITIEPGVYLPGIGGVRWEDTVVVEKSSCRRLTRAPKTIN